MADTAPAHSTGGSSADPASSSDAKTGRPGASTDTGHGLGRRSALVRGGVAAAAATTLLPGLGLTSTACASQESTEEQDSPVQTGADVLAREGFEQLRGRRVGLVTNPTGVLNNSDPRSPHQVRHLVDALHQDTRALVAVFGPEHGFRGTTQAGGSEGATMDPRTGLPVYNAYTTDPERLAQLFRQATVDYVVFDIADVGVRFYTYIWTMWVAMQAAARVGAGFLVLDRPNPLGPTVSGPSLDPRFASGVGLLPIALQHGMTVGELARLFDREHLPRSVGRSLPELTVIPVENWTRAEGFPRSDLLWIPPSPNMPTLDTVRVYPGMGLVEGTTLSEGRGTTQPFELIGAPGVDWHWAEELNAANLPGLRFRDTSFVPTFSKHAQQTCGGVQLHQTGAEIDPLRTVVTMLVTLRRRYPGVLGWRTGMADALFGSPRLRTMVDAGASADDIVGSWQGEQADFQRARQPHLLYD